MSAELNDACRTIVSDIMTGERNVIDDAKHWETMDDLDIEVVHEYRGYTVILRFSLYNGWHDSDGPMQEFDPYDVEVNLDE